MWYYIHTLDGEIQAKIKLINVFNGSLDHVSSIDVTSNLLVGDFVAPFVTGFGKLIVQLSETLNLNQN